MSGKYRIPLHSNILKTAENSSIFMIYSEIRAHLQSFETKIEFIQPKLTEIWQFEIWKFLKIFRNNRKAYGPERVNKWWKT